jgi:L-threonylcarbamoyladenylate synthase
LQHYAPQTPLELVPAGALAKVEAAATARGERVATLACPRGCDPASYGRTLYAELRRLDKLGVSRILVESVPESPQWDAVRDRLSRAAATFL